MPFPASTGLTTSQAPFIEAARSRGELYIRQPYELYTEANHEAWRQLYARMRPRWERFANEHFLDGLSRLALPSDRIPNLDEVNKALEPLTGFRARPVSGYVPVFTFFDCLRRREFPTTVTIRDARRLDYLPEPDIFHDIAGHVPMHTHPAFARALVRFGECAHTAVQMDAPAERLASRIRAMARFFWFTVEFGLMRGGRRLFTCGSGLLSSYGEIQHAVESPNVERRPLKLEEVIHQPFEIDHYQPLLFVLESFDHLYEQVNLLDRWMLEGRLDEVAPGEPAVSADDLRSFLDAKPAVH